MLFGSRLARRMEVAVFHQRNEKVQVAIGHVTERNGFLLGLHHGAGFDNRSAADFVDFDDTGHFFG